MCHVALTSHLTNVLVAWAPRETLVLEAQWALSPSAPSQPSGSSCQGLVKRGEAGCSPQSRHVCGSLRPKAAGPPRVPVFWDQSWALPGQAGQVSGQAQVCIEPTVPGGALTLGALVSDVMVYKARDAKRPTQAVSPHYVPAVSIL